MKLHCTYYSETSSFTVNYFPRHLSIPINSELHVLQIAVYSIESMLYNPLIQAVSEFLYYKQSHHEHLSIASVLTYLFLLDKSLYVGFGVILCILPSCALEILNQFSLRQIPKKFKTGTQKYNCMQIFIIVLDNRQKEETTQISM